MSYKIEAVFLYWTKGQTASDHYEAAIEKYLEDKYVLTSFFKAS